MQYPPEQPTKSPACLQPVALQPELTERTAIWTLWGEELQLRKGDALQPRELMAFERIDFIDSGLSTALLEGAGVVSDDHWEEFLARVNHQTTPFAFHARRPPSVLLGRFVHCPDCQPAFVIAQDDEPFLSFDDDVAGLQRTDTLL